MATFPENKDPFINRAQRSAREAIKTCIHNFFRRFVRRDKNTS